MHGLQLVRIIIINNIIINIIIIIILLFLSSLLLLLLLLLMHLSTLGKFSYKFIFKIHGTKIIFCKFGKFLNVEIF